MIYQLEVDEYWRARKLFAPINYHLAVESIIGGVSPGKIFVDERNSPKSTFTWFKGKAWIAGNADNENFNKALLSTFAKTYYKELIDHKARAFMLFPTPGWESNIDSVWEDSHCIDDLRHYYHLDATTRTWKTSLQKGFMLRPVDGRILAEKHLKHLEDVFEEMQSGRLSVEAFLRKSFGCCIVYDGEIVSWCMSEYNVDNRCELGIATLEGCRRRGLATMVATAVIEHAVNKGITDIGWHCWANNQPSIATALKLGFKKVHEYPVYKVPLPNSEQ